MITHPKQAIARLYLGVVALGIALVAASAVPATVMACGGWIRASAWSSAAEPAGPLIEGYDPNSGSAFSHPILGLGLVDKSSVSALGPTDVLTAGQPQDPQAAVAVPSIWEFDGTSWTVVSSPSLGLLEDPFTPETKIGGTANAGPIGYRPSQLQPTRTIPAPFC